jgi:hypothetical protein
MKPERKQALDNPRNSALAQQARQNVLRQPNRAKFNTEGYLPKAALLFISWYKGDLVVPRNQSNRTFGVLSNDDPVFQ